MTSWASFNKASYVVIIGENEFNKDFYTIKNLNSGIQTELNIEEIHKFLNDQS